ncbi:MAG: PIN domain-containing protein [Gemmatimonadetes bacterium]|nr:PIN domain-containing protein [Gemmatimonadota bacterium]
MGLIDDVGSGPVALDTAAFIYVIEAHPLYLPALLPVFAAADREELTIVTSAVTLLEVLVVPYRAGNMPLATRYEEILTRSRGVLLREIDRGQLRAAAQLRAVSAMRTPDALQLAAALTDDCTAFVTNDQRLRSPAGLPVLQLVNYI